MTGWKALAGAALIVGGASAGTVASAQIVPQRRVPAIAAVPGTRVEVPGAVSGPCVCALEDFAKAPAPVAVALVGGALRLEVRTLPGLVYQLERRDPVTGLWAPDLSAGPLLGDGRPQVWEAGAPAPGSPVLLRLAVTFAPVE